MQPITLPQQTSIFDRSQAPHLMMNLIEGLAIHRLLQYAERSAPSPLRTIFVANFRAQSRYWAPFVSSGNIIVSIAITIILHGNLLGIARAARSRMVTNWPISYAENWIRWDKLALRGRLQLITSFALVTLWSVSTLSSHIRFPRKWLDGMSSEGSEGSEYANLTDVYHHYRSQWQRPLYSDLTESLNSFLYDMYSQHNLISRLSDSKELSASFLQSCCKGQTALIKGYTVTYYFFPSCVRPAPSIEKNTLYIVYSDQVGLSQLQLRELLGDAYVYADESQNIYGQSLPIVYLEHPPEELEAISKLGK